MGQFRQLTRPGIVGKEFSVDEKNQEISAPLEPNVAWVVNQLDIIGTEKADSDYNRDKRRLNPDVREVLEKMANDDPSDNLRFEALLALLSHRRTVDVDAMTSLIPAQPKESKVVARLAAYFEANASRVGPGLRPLLAFTDMTKLGDSNRNTVMQRLAGTGEGWGFQSFGSLAHVGDEIFEMETPIGFQPRGYTTDE